MSTWAAQRQASGRKTLPVHINDDNYDYSSDAMQCSGSG